MASPMPRGPAETLGSSS